MQCQCVVISSLRRCRAQNLHEHCILEPASREVLFHSAQHPLRPELFWKQTARDPVMQTDCPRETHYPLCYEYSSAPLFSAVRVRLPKWPKWHLGGLPTSTTLSETICFGHQPWRGKVGSSKLNEDGSTCNIFQIGSACFCTADDKVVCVRIHHGATCLVMNLLWKQKSTSARKMAADCSELPFQAVVLQPDFFPTPFFQGARPGDKDASCPFRTGTPQLSCTQFVSIVADTSTFWTDNRKQI